VFIKIYLAFIYHGYFNMEKMLLKLIIL